MLFNSFEFILIFLPAVLVGYFALGRVHRRWAVGWLAAASVAFYGYWNPKYVALLLASVLFNFAAGRAVARARDSSPRIAWRLAAATIAVDVALLAVYKYADFFIGSVNAAFVVNLPVYGLVLPLGISFFTLTQIAFIADVATGKAREYDFAKYLLFVSYFPHLIAGPVLHHAQVMPQFDHDSTYRPRAERFAAGITFFSIGLAKKVLLADSLGEQATPVFEAARAGVPIDSLSAWTASVAYSLQLYFDFSGYSDMAVGLSRMLGVRLPFNFNSPYKSRSIIDFWRRWHMTLSRFLRDYVYVPLGGNRRGPLRRYANIMVTMLVGGLWHGANWTFVAWGALHGLMLLANHAWRAAATRLG
ncbi:MAG: MBOAT family O-acyltransferase, partial [Usitatibacter sp.]